eukprot:509197_1
MAQASASNNNTYGEMWNSLHDTREQYLWKGRCCAADQQWLTAFRWFHNSVNRNCYDWGNCADEGLITNTLFMWETTKWMAYLAECYIEFGERTNAMDILRRGIKDANTNDDPMIPALAILLVRASQMDAEDESTSPPAPAPESTPPPPAPEAFDYSDEYPSEKSWWYDQDESDSSYGDGVDPAYNQWVDQQIQIGIDRREAEDDGVECGAVDPAYNEPGADLGCGYYGEIAPGYNQNYGAYAVEVGDDGRE